MIVSRIIALVIGYFIGTFQTGYFYGKKHGIDIREHGSGNSGTTNTLRTLGWKAGIITFLGDCFKTVFAVVLAWIIFHNSCGDFVKIVEIYAGFGAVLGHNFPFYMNFKGGKGIACTAGIVVAICPYAIPVCLVVFAGSVAITRYVSVGSILMVCCLMAQIVLFNEWGIMGVAQEHILEFNIVAACFTIMAIWRHRQNIVRLINGTENKFGKKGK